jgi:hypothetical protein
MVLVKRLDARIAKAVGKAAGQCDYRRSMSGWAGGDHCTSVGVSRSSWAPSLRRTSFRLPATACSGESCRVWSHNGKWSGNNSEHHFTVTSDWLRTVQAEGLAVVDGLEPTDAGADWAATAAVIAPLVDAAENPVIVVLTDGADQSEQALADAFPGVTVERAVFATDDPKTGACGSLYTITTDPRSNHQVSVTRGVLQEPCAAILRAAFNGFDSTGGN